MEFWIAVQDGRIAGATFTTDGCGHSIVSGSAAARLAEGRAVETAAAISQAQVLDAAGGLPEESRHCALLAANVLRAAIADWRARRARADAPGAPAGAGAPRESPAGDAGASRPGGAPDETDERRTLRARMGRIAHKILVLSGKGGVGKSTVAVHLAVSLSRAGKRVGLLDVDLHGPSVPKMLRLEDRSVRVEGDALVPLQVGGLKVMSLGFLLQGRDEPVIWRGPMKMGAIRQFLKDVAWGDLDYLVVDSPPGTGDEPLSVCQLLEGADGAVVVTTPQDVATADVRRSIGFCRALKLPVLGVVENMSGFACPGCGRTTEIFKAGGGEAMARETGVPFLGRVPLDPAVGDACDRGNPLDGHAARRETVAAFERIVTPLLDLPRPAGAAVPYPV
jgi:Mrp family chromosome partitioning ATPase